MWLSRKYRYVAFGFGVVPQTGVALYYLRLWNVGLTWRPWVRPRFSWYRHGYMLIYVGERRQKVWIKADG